MYLAREIDAKIMESELMSLWGQTIPINKFKKVLNDVVQPFGATAIVKREKMKDGTKMMIGGEFCASRVGNKIQIYYYFDPSRKSVKVTTRILNRVVFLTSQTLQHEIIHRDQEEKLGADFYKSHIPILHSKRIEKKRKDDIDYLSLSEEIDTIGHDIVMEIMYTYPKENPEDVLASIDTRKIRSYNTYVKTFRNIDWTPIRKSLMMKIWKWIPKTSAPPRLRAT